MRLASVVRLVNTDSLSLVVKDIRRRRILQVYLCREALAYYSWLAPYAIHEWRALNS